MFGIQWSNVCLVALLLMVAGCGFFGSDGNGLGASETVDMSDEYQFDVRVDKGALLALDMPKPNESKLEIVGASFDPTMLTLVNYLLINEGEPRVQYLFKALENGTTDVFIRVRPIDGGDATVYKEVTVTIGRD